MARRRATEDIPGRTGTATGATRSGQLQRVGSAPPSAPAGAILGRRPGRATPRTVLGGLLVAAAAVVVFAVAMTAAAGGGQAPFAVATHALPAGSVIGPGDISTASFGLSGSTKASAFTSPAALIGRTVAVPVGTGQLIETPMLAPPTGSGLRPVSVAVDGNSLAALSPGNSVDVLAFASGSSSSAPPAAATVVLRGATLISIERNGSGLLGAPSTGSSVVVTLGVSDLGEAESIITAAHGGTVELVMAEPVDGRGAGS